MIVPLSSPNLQALAVQRLEDAAYYRRVLHDMINVGAAMVQELPQQIEASDADVGCKAEKSLAYDRLTRAVRRSIMLAEAISGNQAIPGERKPDRAVTRRKILRAVEDRIQSEDSEAAQESLRGELLERLDSPELDEELDTRPVDEIIVELCRDLGIGSLPWGTPWKRRTPEDVSLLHARAAGVAGVEGGSGAGRDWLDVAPGGKGRPDGRRTISLDAEDGLLRFLRAREGADGAAAALFMCDAGPHPGPLP